jgi:tRNA(adenine34) deaminase
MPDSDQHFMQLALALAADAQSQGEVPVGAVVVLDGEVIGSGYNAPISTLDPTAHAEIRALRAAAKAIGNYRLTNTTLYVTMEPCPMCAGAMVHARVNRLVYGCEDKRAGAAGTVFDLARSPDLNHRLEVTGGVLAEPCRDILQAFFKARR